MSEELYALYQIGEIEYEDIVFGDSGDIDNVRNTKQFKIVEQALERNEPKEPIQNNNPRYYDCPNCQDNVSSDENFCPECGQALDWEAK